MQNTIVRHSMIIFLLLIFINRGFFISSAYEIENPDGEINSVAELIVLLITGESNDIDEDGDMQTDCHGVEIPHHDFSQQFAQSLELANLFSKNLNKFGFSNDENLSGNNFHNQIDQPPEV
ncbi:MAG: hypothetical protein FWC34_05280 [Bacteroidetes bacterium]|nr:hypothetical protein [Bacteroidota bacterium]MCL2301684.1 hypothetical protein [Lentimicrobiaceae bacterium]